MNNELTSLAFLNLLLWRRISNSLNSSSSSYVPTFSFNERRVFRRDSIPNTNMQVTLIDYILSM